MKDQPEQREESGKDRDGRERRLAYSPPELAEWGTIRDLTRGGQLGSEDFDFTGTTPI